MSSILVYLADGIQIIKFTYNGKVKLTSFYFSQRTLLKNPQSIT